MSFWEQIKRDLEHEIVEGIDMLKEGAAFVKKKTEELTEEGKRRVNLFELKIKVRQDMTELGGRVYDLMHKGESLFSDNEVKEIVERIEKLEKQIGELEEKK
jgi:polyhydroxyalkanoate synthesis regulator phasin